MRFSVMRVVRTYPALPWVILNACRCGSFIWNAKMSPDVSGKLLRSRRVPGLADLFARLEKGIPKLQDFRGAIALAVNYEYSPGTTELRDGRSGPDPAGKWRSRQ